MSKEYDAYMKAAKAWERAMRFCRTIEDKIEAHNKKMMKRPSRDEEKKIMAVIAKLNKDLMAAGKKENKLHQDMIRAQDALS